MTIIISIEGNIGSGKSTYMNYLKNIYNNDEKVHFLREPIDIWNSITDENNRTLLELFYENQEEYSSKFQTMALITRFELLEEALEKDYKVIITERCIETDRNVFAKMLYDDKKIQEIDYKIYLRCYKSFIKKIPNMFYVYIHTDPNVAYERVNKRSRQGENIPLEYLRNCHHYHNEWLDKEYKIIINGDIDENDNNYQINLTRICDYIDINKI